MWEGLGQDILYILHLWRGLEMLHFVHLYKQYIEWRAFIVEFKLPLGFNVRLKDYLWQYVLTRRKRTIIQSVPCWTLLLPLMSSNSKIKSSTSGSKC